MCCLTFGKDVTFTVVFVVWIAFYVQTQGQQKRLSENIIPVSPGLLNRLAQDRLARLSKMNSTCILLGWNNEIELI